MNKNKFTKLLYCFSLVVFFNITYAIIYHVPEDKQLIQDAIKESESGDTVSIWVHTVPPDTYYENISFEGKNIMVVNRSYISTIQGYPPDPSYVVIDTAHEGSVVTFNSGETRDAILKGFTIRT